MSIALGAWAGAVAWGDAAQRRIPNALLLGLLLPALLVQAWTGHGVGGESWPGALTGALLAAGLLAPAYRAGWLGAGDVKLGALLGFVLGTWRSAEMLLLAAVVLGAQSALVLIRSGREARGVRVAAGPALALTFVAELCGGPWIPVLNN
jgi:prepilin peptidase CpaA